jgi:hypothetical protein
MLVVCEMSGDRVPCNMRRILCGQDMGMAPRDVTAALLHRAYLYSECNAPHRCLDCAVTHTSVHR